MNIENKARTEIRTTDIFNDPNLPITEDGFKVAINKIIKRKIMFTGNASIEKSNPPMASCIAIPAIITPKMTTNSESIKIVVLPLLSIEELLPI